MKRADESIFDDLHGLMAASLKSEIKAYQDRDEPVPASVLSVAVKFLRDNGIDRPMKTTEAIDILNDELPEFYNVIDINK